MPDAGCGIGWSGADNGTDLEPQARQTKSLTTCGGHPDSETPGGQAKGMKFAAQSQKESELIAEILTGDLQLYHQLIRPYERYVYIMTLSCLRSEKEAEEAAQETFVRAFRNLRTLPGDSSFGAWLFGIAREEAGKKLSRRASRQTALTSESQNEDVPVSPAVLLDWPELPSDAVECEEVRNLLRHAVERLPCVCLRVFFLRDVEGLNVSEAAQLLDMNTSQVKAALHLARIMLQRLLAPKLIPYKPQSRIGHRKE